MPHLDGKYEITSQRAITPELVHFTATAPDGTPLSIDWYEFEQLDDELAFERYRQLLRTLKREQLAAVHDVVARPGAHYVAWRLPDEGSSPSPATELKQLEPLLERFGYRLSDASLYRNGDGKVRVYQLALRRGEGDYTAPLRTPVVLESAPPTTPPDSGTRRAKLIEQLWYWLPGAILGTLGFIFLLSSFEALTASDLVIVPDLIGAEVNRAAEHASRLRLVVEAEAVPSNEPAGTVIDMVPRAGSQLRGGRTIRLRYALPPGQISPTEVPELRGLQHEAEVRGALEQQQLSLGRVAQVPAAIEEGTVIAQSTPPGQQLAQGSEVDVLMSSGPLPDMTFVPNLRGLPIDTALELAQVAGLANPVEQEWVSAAHEPAGTVIDQNLASNKLVPRDATTLRLTVAGMEERMTPPSPAQDDTPGAPNLVGMSRSQAERTAEAEGLEITRVETLQDLNLPEGVIYQDPEPGRAIGSSLQLTINRYPEPRTLRYSWPIEMGIPDVTARVTAITEEGEETLVATEQVRGGDRVEGEWETLEFGPVTFELTLNNEPYSEPITVEAD